MINNNLIIFDEYIRCKLYDYKERKHCGAASGKSVTDFRECFCVSKIIFDFTKKFFFPNSTISFKCKCPCFGFNTDEVMAGYTIYDRFDMNGRSANVYDLLILLNSEIVIGLPAERIYARLLPVYMNDLLERYVKVTDFVKTPNITSMLDDLRNAYNGNLKEYSNFLTEIYFYICFCVRGSTTFTMVEIVQIYNKIVDFSPYIGNAILKEFNAVFDGLTNGKSLKEIVEENPKNYLACVHILLKFISSKMDTNCVFQSVFKHLKDAFSIKDSNNTIYIKNFIPKMKEKLKSLETLTGTSSP